MTHQLQLNWRDWENISTATHCKDAEIMFLPHMVFLCSHLLCTCWGDIRRNMKQHLQPLKQQWKVWGLGKGTKWDYCNKLWLPHIWTLVDVFMSFAGRLLFIMHKLFVLHFYISIDIYVWRFHRLVISQQSAVLAYKGHFFFLFRKRFPLSCMIKANWVVVL